MDEKASILIIDDDQSICKSLALIFGKKGFETETAETGKEALKKAGERFFNIALLDMKLPDLDGVELIRPLKEMHPDLVVIISTAYASLENTVVALNQGASAYIMKPLNMDEVLATVEECLEKQRLVVENRKLYRSVQRELAERRRMEEEIRRHCEDLALINSLNSSINRGDSLQEVIRRLSGQIKRIYSVDGATLYLFSENKEHLVLQNLRLPSSAVNRIEKLIGMKIPKIIIPLTADSLYTEVLHSGKPKIISDPASIERLMADFTETTHITDKHLRKSLLELIPKIYKILKLKSVMILPLISKDEAISMISVSAKRVLTETDLIRLQAIFAQLTVAIKRKQYEEMIKRRLKLEETISKISSRFVGVSNPDTAITGSLKDIGRLCGAGRAYLFQFSADGKTMNNTHEWCAGGVSPQIDKLRNLPIETFPWWIVKLRRGETIHITDISKMPDKAAAERKILESQGIKSLLALPVYIMDELAGFIGFDNVKETGGWSDYDISILGLTAEIIGKVLERRSFEEKILRQKDLLASTIESLPHPFYVIDAKDRTIKLANSATYAGSRQKDITCYALTHKSDKPCESPEHPCPRETVRKTGQPVVVEHIHYDNEGNPRNIEVYAYPVFDPAGNVAQVIEYTLDITERKRLEDRLKREKERAEAADKLKSFFLANMSHEIRTPLNSIIGFTDLVLSGDDLSEENRDYLQISKESGNLLLALINGILDLSKIEAGQLHIEEISCSLERVLNAVGSNGRVLIAGKGKPISLRGSIAPNLSRYIVTDHFRLEQIMNNLIGNAIKFTDEGFIEFGVSLKDEQTLEFYVRDTGIGIPEDKQMTIFEAFQQTDVSTTRKYGGTGLGLTISKKLVELLGGKIYVCSKGEGGSTFYFCIPYKPIEAPEEEREAEVKITETKTSSTVLVAEDNPINQKLVQTILQKNGYSVVMASDGRDAVSRYKTYPSISLILMDIQMPHLNGLKAAQVIRNIEKEEGRNRMPIVALTAAAMKEDEKKCLEAGCDAYLTKPLDKNLLLDAVRKYIQ